MTRTESAHRGASSCRAESERIQRGAFSSDDNSGTKAEIQPKKVPLTIRSRALDRLRAPPGLGYEARLRQNR